MKNEILTQEDSKNMATDLLTCWLENHSEVGALPPKAMEDLVSELSKILQEVSEFGQPQEVWDRTATHSTGENQYASIASYNNLSNDEYIALNMAIGYAQNDFLIYTAKQAGINISKTLTGLRDRLK